MYLRIINLNKGVAHYRYLKLVESTRVKGKPVQKTILNFGNIEDRPPERVADLISRPVYHYADLRVRGHVFVACWPIFWKPCWNRNCIKQGST